MTDDAQAMTLMVSATLVAASAFSLWPVSAVNVELLDDVLHQAVLRDPLCGSTRDAIRSLSPERGANRSSLNHPLNLFGLGSNATLRRGVYLQPSLRNHGV